MFYTPPPSRMQATDEKRARMLRKRLKRSREEIRKTLIKAHAGNVPQRAQSNYLNRVNKLRAFIERDQHELDSLSKE